MSIDALSNSDPAAADEPEPSCDLTIHLDVETSQAPDLAWIQRKLKAVVDRLKLESVSLSVVIVDDASIADMHVRFLNVEGTTDVITFDLSDSAPPLPAGEGRGEGAFKLNPPPHRQTVDGELYLCLDEATRQAQRFGHTVDAELLLYAVHGLLHLLGYDDHDPENHRIMHDTEDQLLTAIGVGPVFARREGEGR